MPTWLDDRERTLQFLLRVQHQDPLELGMHGIPG
jgi:hypothetical protein